MTCTGLWFRAVGVEATADIRDRHLELVEGKSDWQAHADALRAWLENASNPLARRTCRVEIARIEYAKRERWLLWEEEYYDRLRSRYISLLDSNTE